MLQTTNPTSSEAGAAKAEVVRKSSAARLAGSSPASGTNSKKPSSAGGGFFVLYIPRPVRYLLGMSKLQPIIPIERIASRIYLIRGEKVMLDSDLAKLYGVKPIALRQQVKRNIERFPDDFVFQLTDQEVDALVSQNVIPSRRVLGGFLPYVFTEQGVAMLSSVLRSKRAVQVNVAIIRTFVKVRQILATNRDLARKVQEHDRQISILFETVQKLLEPPPLPKKNHIGYIPPKD